MHRLSTNFILGYHGCDHGVAEHLLSGKPFRQSSNDYDWLGPGVYFWEANPQRGLNFAIEASTRKRTTVKEPTVIGAIIDLGLCLDMTTLRAIDMVRAAYVSLEQSFKASGEPMPINDTDLLRRWLDCAVVRRLHSVLEQDAISLDTVRGVFIEGSPIYPNAGFNEKTHTQIAVRNLDCIKGVFRVPEEQLQRGLPAG